MLVVPPKHRWARRKEICLDDLLNEPFIVRESGSGTRRCLEQNLQQAGLSLSDLKVVLELGSTQAVKQAVTSRAGVTILSRFAVERELKLRQLKMVKVQGLKMERYFYMVTNSCRALSPAAQAPLISFNSPTPTVNNWVLSIPKP